MEGIFLGLGANLGDPRASVEEAVTRLSSSDARVLRRARLYRTPPLGPQDQPDYVNTVVEIESDLAPRALLASIKRLERAMGRATTIRWGPRIIDVDILLFGDDRIDEPDLGIPHREMARRSFVLAPLADLAPNLVIPGVDQTVVTLMEALDLSPGALEVIDQRILTFARA